ncbi:hypothetical protein Tco_0251894 [Tanacetum coccineum]
MINESLEHVVLAKESSQLQSSYEAVATLTEFELKKILIDKMDKSELYLAATEHRDCYEGLKKSYELDKTFFSTYDKVYLLKRSRKDKDKDEDPFAGSDRGLKKRKTSKDAKSAKGPKTKESQSGSSKGDKSKSKSSGNSIQSEEPEFEVADLDMPYDQEENLGNDDVEPKEKIASKCDWFTKPTHPQEPTDPDSNVDKTPQKGQNQCWLMTLASSAEKPLKPFDELMSTPIDFSAFIINGLKINNLTQETLLGPTFRLLKGTRANYAELEYDFEECYKALSEKLDWENPEGGDYPFDLTKPLPLVMSRNCQKVPVDYFFNNDLKYLQGGILTMTYTTSLIKTKVVLYDLPGIEVMVEVMRKHGYGYLKEIVVRRDDNILYRFKEGDSPHLRINDVEDMLLLNQRDLPRDIPLDSVVVLRYEKRSKSKNKRKVPTEMELIMEQTHQGTSYEVSVSAKGDEELKRKVKIKGEKKEALLTLSNDLRVLRIILVILPKHPSDTYVFTVKMEILLEPTSNKLLVEVLERFNTSAGNPVKEILLKLNLPDHRSILTDSKEHIKMEVERRSVKDKELQDKRILKAFKLSYLLASIY